MTGFGGKVSSLVKFPARAFIDDAIELHSLNSTGTQQIVKDGGKQDNLKYMTEKAYPRSVRED